MRAPRTSRRRTRRDEPETTCVLARGVRMRSDQKDVSPRPPGNTGSHTRARRRHIDPITDACRMATISSGLSGESLESGHWRLTLKEDRGRSGYSERHPQSPQ